MRWIQSMLLSTLTCIKRKCLHAVHTKLNISHAVTVSKYVWLSADFSFLTLITDHELTVNEPVLLDSFIEKHGYKRCHLRWFPGIDFREYPHSQDCLLPLFRIACNFDNWTRTVIGLFVNSKSESVTRNSKEKTFLVNCVWVKMNENKHQNHLSIQYQINCSFWLSIKVDNIC